MKLSYKYNLCEFSASLQNNFQAYLWLIPAAVLRMQQYLNVRSQRVKLGSPAFMDMWFRSIWHCVFQHHLSELFFSDLCQLVLAETVPPGSDNHVTECPPASLIKRYLISAETTFLPCLQGQEWRKGRKLKKKKINTLI